MSKLSTQVRAHMHASLFGLPKERKYPMPDREHAANAKARAKQQLDAGHITHAEYEEIIRKADAKLGEKEEK